MSRKRAVFEPRMSRAIERFPKDVLAHDATGRLLGFHARTVQSLALFVATFRYQKTGLPAGQSSLAQSPPLRPLMRLLTLLTSKFSRCNFDCLDTKCTFAGVTFLSCTPSPCVPHLVLSLLSIWKSRSAVLYCRPLLRVLHSVLESSTHPPPLAITIYIVCWVRTSLSPPAPLSATYRTPLSSPVHSPWLCAGLATCVAAVRPYSTWLIF